MSELGGVILGESVGNYPGGCGWEINVSFTAPCLSNVLIYPRFSIAVHNKLSRSDSGPPRQCKPW